MDWAWACYLDLSGLLIAVWACWAWACFLCLGCYSGGLLVGAVELGLLFNNSSGPVTLNQVL